jgi:hypothetical protein
MIVNNVKPPPKIAQKLLSVSFPLRIRQSIIAELIEEYHMRSKQYHPIINDL